MTTFFFFFFLTRRLSESPARQLSGNHGVGSVVAGGTMEDKNTQDGLLMTPSAAWADEWLMSQGYNSNHFQIIQ